MNQEERREQAAGITTALVLGTAIGLLIIKAILILVY
jgi:hypothetical protein